MHAAESMKDAPREPAILPVSQLPETGAAYRSALAVFWETANTHTFDDAVARLGFVRKYFDYYWERAPELFLLAFDGPMVPGGADPAVLGYVCAVADTRDHDELYELSAHLALFADLYAEYPAHLHINLTAASRGRGLGGRLIAGLEQRLAVPGLHLVTDSGARNARFYRKNGFTHEVVRRLGGADGPELLFMGKRL